jgi:hypothetical protein
MPAGPDLDRETLGPLPAMSLPLAATAFWWMVGIGAELFWVS